MTHTCLAHDGHCRILILILIMARLTHVLVLLSCVLLRALCCDWLRRYGALSDRCLSLVQVLGHPVEDRDSPLPFPRGLYKLARKSEVACKMAFVRDSLGHILDLYQEVDDTAAGWDADRTEELLVVLHRQKDEVAGCVSPGNSTCSFAEPLQRYYRTLAAAALNRTAGSNASWELVRGESKLHLQQLHLLVAAM
uniref:interferon a3-like n=1 Tax=Doryrhamphus excisus TaxID=161450 RepID=UPI0025AE04E3|nr:interferon a3-like [Doryrhamphus excisus]